MTDKKEAPADPIADNRAAYDHKEGVYTEPKVGDEPKVTRHQVDARQNIEVEADNGPIPRRGDPFAAQRDEKAAAAEYKKEEKKDDDSKK